MTCHFPIFEYVIAVPIKTSNEGARETMITQASVDPGIGRDPEIAWSRAQSLCQERIRVLAVDDDYAVGEVLLCLNMLLLSPSNPMKELERS